MSRILYALSGEGYGHVSRVMTITERLEAAGHEVHFCAGGLSEKILRQLGRPCHHIPPFTHYVIGNHLHFFRTFGQNIDNILRQNAIFDGIEAYMRDFGAELLLNDYEAYSWRVAKRLGIPYLSVNNQDILIHSAKGEVPYLHTIPARLAQGVSFMIAPRLANLRIITALKTFKPLKPEVTRVIPPIIRPEILSKTATQGDHLLVYLNQTEGATQFLQTLADAGQPCRIYGFANQTLHAPNLSYHAYNLTEFANDLASCKGVISTAGFMLIGEAMYLRKPFFALPNEGQFEQFLNARFVLDAGVGMALFNRYPSKADLRAFAEGIEKDRFNMPDCTEAGNEAAFQHIQAFISAHE